MAATKTRPTDESVTAHLDRVAQGEQRADCDRLLALLGRVTGASPRLWGTSIIGFGQYRYRYESGHSGESALVGFAVRKTELVLYLAPALEAAEPLLERLGPHRRGKGCLYLRRLAAVDSGVLEELVRSSVDELRRRYPDRPPGA